jgi:hypothetical protein
VVRVWSGEAKLKQLFEEINACSDYGRGMVNDLRDDMLNRGIQSGKSQLLKRTNSSTTIILLQQFQIKQQKNDNRKEIYKEI